MIEFPKDFKEFLQLLNSKEVEYLIISKSDLLLNKRASGRPKDLADCSRLQEK